MKEENAFDKMNKKIEKFSNKALKTIWNALSKEKWNSKDFWDRENEITMDEWCLAVSNEMDKRNLKKPG